MEHPQIRESQTPNMNALCPHCETRLSVPPSKAGAVVSCPKCNGKFQLPIPTAVVQGQLAGKGPIPNSVSEFANKKIAAGLCGILLGGFGVHKFILGFNTSGAIMLSVWMFGFISGLCLIVPLLLSVAIGIIGLVEGILYLTKSDADFYQTYAIERREWF